jgi:hypothetical protein
VTVRTITEYFTRRLEGLGYTADNVYWSLGYSQGDGMDFEGCGDAQRLYTRLMGVPPTTDVTDALRDARVKVTRSGHYHHYNSMSVELEWDDEDAASEIKELMSQFAAAVEQDVIDTSRTLEKEGYAILEACNPFWFQKSKLWKNETFSERAASVRTFRRGPFEVEVAMYDNDHLGGYESGDEEADHADMMRMVGGEIVSYDLCVRIKADGFAVFQEWAHGVTDGRNEIRPFQVARELMRAARPVLRSRAMQLSRLAGRESREF